MVKKEIPKLYERYFVDKNDERKVLFEKIKDLFNPQRGLYPGSFVHITPSFYIKEMIYIDSDKRILNFFKDQNVCNYISLNKAYNGTPKIQAHQADFTTNLPIGENYVDIMFSFYSGFISQYCKRYLKKDGLLICNNSHGDASIAFTDIDYKLIAVVKRNGNNFNITDKDLDQYFIKKDGSLIDNDKVKTKMKGEIFTKNEFAYLFKIAP